MLMNALTTLIDVSSCVKTLKDHILVTVKRATHWLLMEYPVSVSFCHTVSSYKDHCTTLPTPFPMVTGIHILSALPVYEINII